MKKEEGQSNNKDIYIYIYIDFNKIEFGIKLNILKIELYVNF